MGAPVARTWIAVGVNGGVILIFVQIGIPPLLAREDGEPPRHARRATRLAMQGGLEELPSRAPFRFEHPVRSDLGIRVGFRHADQDRRHERVVGLAARFAISIRAPLAGSDRYIL